MFHRKFILSITITRSKLSNPLFMLIRIFLFARNFVSREFYQPFDQPPSSVSSMYILSYHSFMQARFQREIYPQGEILTETSRLGTIPRLCSTMPQEPRQPPRSAIKAKVTVYLSRKKISSLDETNTYAHATIVSSKMESV